jgi:hypothetical protein
MPAPRGFGEDARAKSLALERRLCFEYEKRFSNTRRPWRCIAPAAPINWRAVVQLDMASSQSHSQSKSPRRQTRAFWALMGVAVIARNKR